MTETRYRIGSVARLSGLSTHAIRVWERRYQVLAPERSEGGARLYTEQHLERLKLLKRAVDAGHAIGQIAVLDDHELRRLLGLSSETISTTSPAASDNLLGAIIAAVQRFDSTRAASLLDRAQASYSARALVRDVFTPLLNRIGNAWADGTLCAANEHVATAMIRDRAGALLRQFSSVTSKETLLVTTPAGELHELGALMAAVCAAMNGCGVVYLGPNLPASEIALAARGSGASVVVLSVVALAPDSAAREIRCLAEELPIHVTVVLGGAGANAVATQPGITVTALESLEHFEQWLTTRSTSPNLPH